MDPEALELLAHGFTRDWIVTLYRGTHGLWRVAVPYHPANGHQGCPNCGESCPSGVMPCVAYARVLPEPVQLLGAPNWAAISADEGEVESKSERSARFPDEDHFINAKGHVRRLGPKVGAAGCVHRRPEFRARISITPRR